MALYLKHYFDPDFDYQDLHHINPVPGTQSDTDLYNFGYVQNVVKGQILAEIVPLETIDNPIPHYILQDSVFPQGPNTRVDPAHPNYLLADENGYVFYYEDKISVKHMLNVRSNVDFHTGNVFFVGDAKVHFDVRAGFSIQANIVEVDGLVEGGEVRARQGIKVLGGVRGGTGNRCMLDSRGSLNVAFAEKAELRSVGKMIIEKNCLYSNIYSSGNVIVNDRLTGGICRAEKTVLIKGDLGNKAGVSTKLFLGYDPHLVRRKQQFEKRIDVLMDRITHYQAVVGHLPPDANDLTRKLQDALKKHKMLIVMRDDLRAQEEAQEPATAAARLIVLGNVFPGVQISIGKAILNIPEEMHNVLFHRQEDEIKIIAIPQEKVQSFRQK